MPLRSKNPSVQTTFFSGKCSFDQRILKILGSSKNRVGKKSRYLRVKLHVIAFIVAAPVPHSSSFNAEIATPVPPAGPFFPAHCNVGSHCGKPRPRCDRISMAIAAYVRCANKYNYK